LTPASRDLQHILTDCIGQGTCQGLTVDVEHFRLLDDDRLLLCTNGLTDTVSTEEIENILALQATPDRQCHRLVDMALELGAPDDVTALIAHYQIPA
jgi:serine/threonine protein phosphatase PrpC